MKKDFHKIRFTLFTCSYAGQILIKYLRTSQRVDFEVKRLSNILLLNKDQVYHLLFLTEQSHSISTVKDLNSIKEEMEKLWVYLMIEKEMYILDQEKKDKNCLALQDYERALLAPAIERVAGNNLNKIKDDHEFDQMLTKLYKTYNNWYYWVSSQYRLPTLRVLPFILRLIQL